MVMVCCILHREIFFFFFSSRRRHTRLQGDWSSDVCSSDLLVSLGSVNRVWLSFWGLLLVVGVIGLGILVPLGDRKSTRLNSSHLVISYAVFCLKKKKKKNTNRPSMTTIDSSALTRYRQTQY